MRISDWSSDVCSSDLSGWSDNNGSCVLKIDGPFSVLLPGDIERQAEARLLHVHENELKADVMIAPHHGSKTSSTADFVAAVAPQLVIFPAGWQDRKSTRLNSSH